MSEYYEAIINENEVDTISPVTKIRVYNDCSYYDYFPEDLIKLELVKRED